ncbi:MAG: hypothetical protein ACKVQS_09520 [Fimbriimonadaceae bacterium]
MKSHIWVFPGAIGPELESIWESPPEGLKCLAELGEVVRLAPTGQCFESDLVGLPEDVYVPKGPLIVSAFGWEPPRKSVHFELTLLSVGTDGLLERVGSLTKKESRALAEQFPRLATRKLTPKWGEQLTHGLVWEDGSLELGCHSPSDAVGQLWTKNQPEGDGEYMLRALIDDSLNLLDGLELNRRREDEGKPKANLLWPHSFGFRPDLPYLPLHRGEIFYYFSDQIGIEGMTQLVGYEHCNRQALRRGIHLDYSLLKVNLFDPGGFVIADDQLGTMLEVGRGEEARYAIEKLEEKIWELFALDLSEGADNHGAILCPGVRGEPGMGLIFGNKKMGDGIPFDVRAWDDRRLRNLRFSEVMANLLGG